MKTTDQEKQGEEFGNTVGVLLNAIKLRDQYTANHSRRVSQYVLLLAQELKIPPQAKTQLQIGALLHDVGILGIGDSILHKQGPLTAEEFEIMKTHTIIGGMILEQSPQLIEVIPIVRSHHERWAGDGYPDFLKGEQIPYPARIIAVAEAFDAMTSDHPYRHKMPTEGAFTELEEQRGKQFDPEIARTFIEMRERVIQIMIVSGGSTTPMTTKATS